MNHEAPGRNRSPSSTLLESGLGRVIENRGRSGNSDSTDMDCTFSQQCM